jgi:predicted transcriptional regulator
MRTLKVGIASYEQMKARTLAVPRGKQRVRRGDPRIWFTSMESFAKVLSDRNRALLALIAETQPDSIAELSELSGRAKSNLSRTLKTMERYGLVQLRKGQRGTIVPCVPYSGIALTVPLGSSGRERNLAPVARKRSSAILNGASLGS